MHGVRVPMWQTQSAGPERTAHISVLLWTLCHTTQHRAVLIIFPLNLLQTITITWTHVFCMSAAKWHSVNVKMWRHLYWQHWYMVKDMEMTDKQCQRGPTSKTKWCVTGINVCQGREAIEKVQTCSSIVGKTDVKERKKNVKCTPRFKTRCTSTKSSNISAAHVQLYTQIYQYCWNEAASQTSLYMLSVSTITIYLIIPKLNKSK